MSSMIKSVNEPQLSREVTLTPNSHNEPAPLPEGRPTIEGLNPAEMPHGTVDQLLVVHGDNFIPGCAVTFEGVLLDTEYEAPHKLNATVPNDLEAGTYTVTVELLGASTDGQTFTVNEPAPPPETRKAHPHADTHPDDLVDPDELEEEIEAAEEEGDFKPVHRGRPTKNLPKNRKR